MKEHLAKIAGKFEWSDALRVAAIRDDELRADATETAGQYATHRAGRAEYGHHFAAEGREAAGAARIVGHVARRHAFGGIDVLQPLAAGRDAVTPRRRQALGQLALAVLLNGSGG